MEEFLTIKATWPWPWIGPYGISSCITHRLLPTHQISFGSEKLFVDICTYIYTYVRTDIEASFIRSTRSWPIHAVRREISCENLPLVCIRAVLSRYRWEKLFSFGPPRSSRLYLTETEKCTHTAPLKNYIDLAVHIKIGYDKMRYLYYNATINGWNDTMQLHSTTNSIISFSKITPGYSK